MEGVNLHLIILLVIQLSGTYCGVHERAVLDDIFYNRGYNTLERPVANENQALNVSFGLTLQQLLQVDEKSQVIVTNIWQNVLWHDSNLGWDKAKFGNISEVRVAANKIWKPDILMYNSADESFDGTYHTNVIVYNDGTCYWVPPGMFKSTCNIDITWFPFDDQFCDLKFGSWTYDGTKINLKATGPSADISTFIKNGEWKLIGMPVKKNTVFYDCCPDSPYYDLTFTVHIRRRSLYYICNLVVPSIILSGLALLVFLLPPDAGEKIGLGITIMLSLCMLLMIAADSLPKSSDAIPLLVLYFGAIMVICSFSVVATVMVLSLHHSSPEHHTMPTWIRRGVCEWLAWLLRMKRPGRDMTLKSILQRAQLEEFKMQEKSSASLLANITETDEIHHTSNGGAFTGVKLDKLGGSFDNHSLSTHSCSTRSELRSIYKEIKFLTDKVKSDDADNEIIADWKFAASVIDKFCLYLFSMLIVVCSLSTMLSAPHII